MKFAGAVAGYAVATATVNPVIAVSTAALNQPSEKDYQRSCCGKSCAHRADVFAADGCRKIWTCCNNENEHGTECHKYWKCCEHTNHNAIGCQLKWNCCNASQTNRGCQYKWVCCDKTNQSGFILFKLIKVVFFCFVLFVFDCKSYK